METALLVLASGLEVLRVKKNHAGVYQCFAANGVGRATQSALLRVLPQQVTHHSGITSGETFWTTDSMIEKSSFGKPHEIQVINHIEFIWGLICWNVSWIPLLKRTLTLLARPWEHWLTELVHRHTMWGSPLFSAFFSICFSMESHNLPSSTA